MKTFFPTIYFILLAALGCYGQNPAPKTNTFPSVTTLSTWANYNSQQKFDLEIRTLGFKFEIKEAETSSIAYTYIRKVVIDGVNYTDRIVYRIANDNSASIISLVTASTDLVSLYNPQLATFKNVKCDTPMSKDKNTSCNCYVSKTHAIDICDERVKLTMGDGNKYFISVAKL
ncbi:hypothetical protein [Flavobacterium sp. FPG59]|jgi:ABC-type transport system substrate-binding protein|uniref:hypothetical protein n=1 Tax=Flavobacterium sp. FPG59 TaxID=1929267 RepID=UPI000B6EA774|nr:hypothetical protein [Flavobacterium sp. FPG59]OUD36389.1 hypothetical protein FPG59_06245 [Flavobacterium sp. FPG59]